MNETPASYATTTIDVRQAPTDLDAMTPSNQLPAQPTPTPESPHSLWRRRSALMIALLALAGLVALFRPVRILPRRR